MFPFSWDNSSFPPKYLKHWNPELSFYSTLSNCSASCFLLSFMTVFGFPNYCILSFSGAQIIKLVHLAPHPPDKTEKGKSSLRYFVTLPRHHFSLSLEINCWLIGNFFCLLLGTHGNMSPVPADFDIQGTIPRAGRILPWFPPVINHCLLPQDEGAISVFTRAVQEGLIVYCMDYPTLFWFWFFSLHSSPFLRS